MVKLFYYLSCFINNLKIYYKLILQLLLFVINFQFLIDKAGCKRIIKIYRSSYHKHAALGRGWRAYGRVASSREHSMHANRLEEALGKK